MSASVCLTQHNPCFPSNYWRHRSQPYVFFYVCLICHVLTSTHITVRIVWYCIPVYSVEQNLVSTRQKKTATPRSLVIDRQKPHNLIRSQFLSKVVGLTCLKYTNLGSNERQF